MGNRGEALCAFALGALVLNAIFLPKVVADESTVDGGIIREVAEPGLAKNQIALEIGADCYISPMSLNGLQCDKEGYFITDFLDSVWWDPGQLFPQDWLRVPASQALCCRPSLSEAVVQVTGEQSMSPMSVISVGCHTSSNTGMRAMQCETEGNSFITGFLNSLSPLRAPNTFYPIDGPECCTPVVLMDSGDAWSIERCDCSSTTGEISCDAEQTDRMLWGFEFSGVTGKHVVPLAPAMCCKMCLGEKLHSLSSCEDQNSCSGNGACILDTCSCRTGFGGDDCSKTLKKKSNNWWHSFWWLVVVGFLCAFMGLFATFWLIQRSDWASGNRPNPPEDGLEDPFMDPEGSAGSIDTQSDDSITSVQINIEVNPEPHADPGEDANRAEVEERIERRGIRISTRVRRSMADSEGYAGEEDVYATPHASLPLTSSPTNSPQHLVEGGFDRGSVSEGEGLDDNGLEREAMLRSSTEAPSDVGSSAHFDHSAFNRAQTSSVSDVYQEGAEEEEVEGEEEEEEEEEEKEEAEGGDQQQAEKDAAVLDHSADQNPLGGLSCAICFHRPVQVALVPCGHSNLCRKCSRKLQTCPFCRKEIVRRQKLFLTN